MVNRIMVLTEQGKDEKDDGRQLLEQISNQVVAGCKQCCVPDTSVVRSTWWRQAKLGSIQS